MQKPLKLEFKSPDLVLLKKESRNEIELLQKEIANLKATNKIMRKLSTSQGFFKYYFKNLRSFEKEKQCFDYVNQLFYDCFDEYRYNSYNDFTFKLYKNGK